MRPYPETDLSCKEKKIDNNRHSSARRVIENALRILSTRWRIFYKPIKSTLENTENYTVACLALHNYLRQTNNAVYTPVGSVDSESRDGSIREGEWRSMRGDDENAFKSINPVRGSRYTKDALKVRETLTKYVNSENGSVPWQFDYIRRTSHYAFHFGH